MHPASVRRVWTAQIRYWPRPLSWRNPPVAHATCESVIYHQPRPFTYKYADSNLVLGPLSLTESDTSLLSTTFVAFTLSHRLCPTFIMALDDYDQGQTPVKKESETQETFGATDVLPLDSLPKTRWERSWPIIACGAGLFSDGYLNGVRSNQILPKQRRLD